ncbi:MAG TPA: NYN domain-containing protein [Vicinamibacterales bacterium]|nr:NYN domain-containing protein [Vicinamibacterales bacterium]
MNREGRLRIAVFIDFDNVEIGVRNTLDASFDAGLVLDALKERGEVVSKMAYGDWQRSGGYSRMLTQHAIRMVQRNPTPGGDKNGADINLALDALEMAFTHTHINAFVIVGGDSDFISLVEKLKQYDKQIFIVGGRQFTSQILQRNCHEFIAYENLTGTGTAPAAAGRGRQPGRGVRADRAPIEQAGPLVSRALKVLSEREVSPQLGLLKTTLLQLDSTFSERTYGAGSFRDFAEKLQKAGVLALSQGRGGWMVGPANGAAAPAAMPSADSPDEGQPVERHAHVPAAATQGRATAVIGTPADGVRELARALGSIEIRRWPLYLRNVKQLLRQASPSFDERAYGFASLVDLLRAAHKEGAFRVERDRQGVIRVFQGTAPAGLPSDTPASTVMNESPDMPDVAATLVAADLGVPLGVADASADEPSRSSAEQAPAARSRRSRRRQPSEATRTGRRKTVSAGKIR